MAAAKTGLRKYETSAGYAFAARISAIDEFFGMQGAKTLKFSDSPKHVNLIPTWIVANNPVVGGYFVVEDVSGNTICRFVDEATFAAEFTPT